MRRGGDRAGAGRPAVAPALAAAVLLAGALVAGCTRGAESERAPIHLNPNMDDMPRADAQEASEFFADGKTMRTPVAGTVARDDVGMATSRAFVTGVDGAGAQLAAVPMTVDERLLERGGERYAIYCAPCHGEEADGRGMLTERAAVATADLTGDARIRAFPAGEMFRVISDGTGLMPGYRYPLPPHDRWAIVAWLERMEAESEVRVDTTAAPVPAEATGETAAAGAGGAAAATPAAEAEPAAETPEAPQPAGSPETAPVETPVEARR